MIHQKCIADTQTPFFSDLEPADADPWNRPPIGELPAKFSCRPFKGGLLFDPH